MIREFGQALTLFGFAALSCAASAQSLEPAPLEAPSGGERFSFTPSIGYLGAKATENVYNTGNRTDKLSQLDWKADAVTLGGRGAVQLFEGLTLRGSLWAAVSSGADMRDRDWFLGYQGPDSWTHQSIHPDTRVPKAWQGDISAAYTLTNMGDVGIAGLAGFRRYDVKYRAYGGSFLYSVNALRDTAGTFDPGRLGISYRQKWDTPYLGLGAYYRGETLSVSAEVYGSPISFGHADDVHALRSTLFIDKFSPTGMIGASLGVDYKLTSVLSLAGRLEYTRYVEARGSTRIQNGATGQSFRVPKPGAGADAETLNVSLGVKGKI
jgi:outer membrane protease